MMACAEASPRKRLSVVTLTSVGSTTPPVSSPNTGTPAAPASASPSPNSWGVPKAVTIASTCCATAVVISPLIAALSLAVSVSVVVVATGLGLGHEEVDGLLRQRAGPRSRA